jgi:excisionase family DNA binding protein
MSNHKSATLLHDDRAVTTQRAAILLGLSRPLFMKLLESGAMAHHLVGNQRRVYLRDVLEFAQAGR